MNERKKFVKNASRPALKSPVAPNTGKYSSVGKYNRDMYVYTNIYNADLDLLLHPLPWEEERFFTSNVRCIIYFFK